MAKEWFRNKTWNKEIAEDFEQHLKRSKPLSSKAQHLRIQGVEIEDFDVSIAKELLNRVLTEYPDRFSVGPAKDNLAAIYFKEGNYSKAEEYYRDLLKEEREKTGIYGYFADIKLLKVIVASRQEDKYQEAYELVKGHNIDADFMKSTKYEFSYLAARLCKELGKIEEAQRHAQKALELVDDPTPTAPRHPGFGDIHAQKEELKFLQSLVD